MNKHRGEVGVTINGQKYVMRPTYEAICEWEDNTGLGTVALSQRLGREGFRLRDAVPIVVAATKAAGNPVRADEIRLEVTANGVIAFMEPVLEVVVNALGGGAEQGEARAADDLAKSPSAAS